MNRASPRLVRPRAWPIRWWFPALIAVVVGATLLAIGLVLKSQIEGALVLVALDALRNDTRAVVVREVGPVPEQTMKLDKQVAQQTSATATAVASAPMRSPAHAFNLERAAKVLREGLADRDTAVVVYGLDGTIVEQSAPVGEPILPATALTRALAGSETKFAHLRGSGRVLVFLLPLQTPDGVRVGALQVTRSTDLVDKLQSKITSLLMIAGLTAVVVCGALALWSARLALRPLDRVVTATRVIGAGDLSVRLRSTREDEIGELSSSFDWMLDRLDSSFSAQRQLVADAAHELRTPLAAIGGTIEVLRLGAHPGDDATIRRLLAATGREVDRLVQLVNDLLVLSHLDEARENPTEIVDLQVLLADVADRVEALVQQQRLVRDLSVKATVIGDRDQLARVFLNVLDNALKYTPDAGTVEVCLTTVDGYAVVSVADSGEGIEAEDLPHIFDRFYRGERSRSRRAGGAGLGLAITRGIVEQHGGSITAVSTRGRGTTITVRLPLSG